MEQKEPKRDFVNAKYFSVSDLLKDSSVGISHGVFFSIRNLTRCENYISKCDVLESFNSKSDEL